MRVVGQQEMKEKEASRKQKLKEQRELKTDLD